MSSRPSLTPKPSATVSFPSRGLKLAANLYLPSTTKGEGEGGRHAGIVVVHPFSGVKEQTSSFYASLLAEKGFAAVAYDAAYQGESEGKPRHREDPYQRAEDVSAAVTFLRSRPDVDPERIGVLGICAGGGYAVYTTRTDSRIKAVATISAVCAGSFMRDGLAGSQTPEGRAGLLAKAAASRDAQDRGEASELIDLLPSSSDVASKSGSFVCNGFDYYKTERGQHPSATTQVTACSVDLMIGFDAFNRIAMISPRPLLMIAGTDAETRYFSQAAIEQAGGPKELYLIEGATHFDLYDDKKQLAGKVVDKVTDFFTKSLK